MKHYHKYSILLLCLLSVFLVYNCILYTSDSDFGEVHLSKKAIKGENIWLKNNCNSCHQIYGLGGYLGPDLTNAYSRISNEDYLKAMFNSGAKAMPKFNFNEEERNQLAQFLKEIDQTGFYPNLQANSKNNGWVTIKYKDQHYE